MGKTALSVFGISHIQPRRIVMEFKVFKKKSLQTAIETVKKEKDHITSEADVRRALVLPLFKALGYNTGSASEEKQNSLFPTTQKTRQTSLSCEMKSLGSWWNVRKGESAKLSIKTS